MLNSGSTEDRPVPMVTVRTADSLPQNVGSGLYIGFTFHETTGNTFQIATSITLNAVTWTPENTVAGKTIPADAPREGTTANRPSGQYVYDNLYVGFEYHDTTINRYIFVNSMKTFSSVYTA